MIGLSSLLIGIVLFIFWWKMFGKKELNEDQKETYGELRSDYYVGKNGLEKKIKIDSHEEHLGGN